RAGRLEESVAQFERLLGYANDLGLYAEEIDPQTGAALGNFPQAFTHVGLISAALAITAATGGERAPGRPGAGPGAGAADSPGTPPAAGGAKGAGGARAGSAAQKKGVRM
ncbi:MAG: hypothetical protein JOZ15_11280, partial [Acidobacteria bacterium]|nr:hypothetical protein [Acidobacteriota bacterium]